MMTYLAAWSEELITLAKSKGIRECDLYGARATRARLESYLEKQDPSLVVLNGHGNTTCVCGHDNESLLDMNSDLGARIVYARSCSAGEDLGPRLAERGATFIGYAREFGIVRLIAKLAHPLEDSLAALFLKPSNLVVSTLLKGHTAGEAHARSRDAMRKNLQKLLSSTATDEERAAAPVLWRNMKWQVLHGDPLATIA